MRQAPLRALSGIILLTGLLGAAEHGLAVPAEKLAAAPRSDTIFVFGTEFNASARLTFMLPDRQPSLNVRQVAGAVEVRSNDADAFELVNIPQLREVAGVDVRKDGDASVAVIRLSGDYQVQEQDTGNKVRLDLVGTAAEREKNRTRPRRRTKRCPIKRCPTRRRRDLPRPRSRSQLPRSWMPYAPGLPKSYRC